jgi:FlaG/FlaF family flagellin (archaellin)
MNGKHEVAVSPVVGVMLMLVVVIIIAAVVSAFAGGVVGSQKKVPQATFSGKFSLSDGFRINHDGGDSLATADTVFVVRNGPLFGPNLEQKSAQVLNISLITNSQGQVLNTTTAIIAGDSLFITPANTACNLLQPGIASSPDLCFSNTTNIGKTFILDVSDTKGDLISRSDVTIAP